MKRLLGLLVVLLGAPSWAAEIPVLRFELQDIQEYPRDFFLALSPDGTLMAVGHYVPPTPLYEAMSDPPASSLRISIYTVKDGKETESITLPPGQFYPRVGAFTPTNDMLYLLTRSRVLFVYKRATHSLQSAAINVPTGSTEYLARLFWKSDTHLYLWGIGVTVVQYDVDLDTLTGTEVLNDDVIGKRIANDPREGGTGEEWMRLCVPLKTTICGCNLSANGVIDGVFAESRDGKGIRKRLDAESTDFYIDPAEQHVVLVRPDGSFRIATVGQGEERSRSWTVTYVPEFLAKYAPGLPCYGTVHSVQLNPLTGKPLVANNDQLGIVRIEAIDDHTVRYEIVVDLGPIPPKGCVGTFSGMANGHEMPLSNGYKMPSNALTYGF